MRHEDQVAGRRREDDGTRSVAVEGAVAVERAGTGAGVALRSLRVLGVRSLLFFSLAIGGMPARISYRDFMKRSRSKRKMRINTFIAATDLGFIKKHNGSYSVKCNRPKRTPGKKKKFAVLACNATEMKIVRFGDPRMEHYREGRKSRSSRWRGHGDEKRRISFKKRHRCHEKNDIMTPSYWSCHWSW